MKSVPRRINGDCAAYAISTYLGIDYDIVIKLLPPITGRGIPSHEVVQVLRDLWTYGGCELRAGIPPSGVSWYEEWRDISGIVGFYRPGRSIGHLAAVRDGIVLDFDGTSTPLHSWCEAKNLQVLIVYY